MARGDPTYCQVDVEIFPNGERFSTLDAPEAFLYLALWALAVKVRSEDIPRDTSTPKWVAEWTHKCPKSVRRWMDKLSQKRLITRNANGTLTVHMVRDCHKRLRFDRCPQRANTGQFKLPSTRPELGGEIERLRDREISTDPDTKIPTPGDRGVSSRSRSCQSSLSPEQQEELDRAQNRIDRRRAELGIPPPAGLTAATSVTGQALENLGAIRLDPEREAEKIFLNLWPHGEYDWDSEKAAFVSAIRKYGFGPFNVALTTLWEMRKEHKAINNELAYLIGIARGETEKRSAKENLEGRYR